MSVPNLISKNERAGFVYGAMLNVQRELMRLGTEQVLNDASDDSPVTSLSPSEPGGDVPSYGTRRAQLQTGLETLWSDNADVHEEITRMAAAEEQSGE